MPKLVYITETNLCRHYMFEFKIFFHLVYHKICAKVILLGEKGVKMTEFSYFCSII